MPRAIETALNLNDQLTRLYSKDKSATTSAARIEYAALLDVAQAAAQYRAARSAEPCNWTNVELALNNLVAALNRAARAKVQP